MPYRSVFDVVWSGRRHIMMMASQIDRTGNQNISAVGPHDHPKVQLVGVRGAPGNSVNHPTSYWVPDHSPRTFVEHVDVVCGVGLRPRRGRRVRAPRASTTSAASSPTSACSTSRRPTARCACARTTPASGRGHRRRHRLRAHHPRRRRRDAPADPRGARPHPCGPRPGLAARPGGADLSARTAAHAPLHPALHTALCERVGVRYPLVQTGMGWVAGPRLVAATCEAGGLGILASATMTLDQLADGHRRGAQPDHGAVRGQPAHRRGRRRATGSS